LTGDTIQQRTEYPFRHFFGNIALSQVYRELSQLEDQGWVSFCEVGIDDRVARAYRLTDEARDQLRAWASSARFDPRRCGSRWRSRCGWAT
jgi:DNA-binding PadR family transcriptional regulator